MAAPYFGCQNRVGFLAWSMHMEAMPGLDLNQPPFDLLDEAASKVRARIEARGATLAEARDRAYGLVDGIDWPEGFCRRDIGWRAL